MPLSKKKNKERMNQQRVQPKQGVVQPKVHPIMEALANPEKRKKLEAICASLKAFNQLENVSYGIPRPIPMSRVSELLEAF